MIHKGSNFYQLQLLKVHIGPSTKQSQTYSMWTGKTDWNNSNMLHGAIFNGLYIKRNNIKKWQITKKYVFEKLILSQKFLKLLHFL